MRDQRVADGRQQPYRRAGVAGMAAYFGADPCRHEHDDVEGTAVLVPLLPEREDGLGMFACHACSARQDAEFAMVRVAVCCRHREPNGNVVLAYNAIGLFAEVLD